MLADVLPRLLGDLRHLWQEHPARTFDGSEIAEHEHVGVLRDAQVTRHDDFEVRNASAGPDAIVYEQAGFVHLLDVKTGQARQLAIDVKGDLPWARPQMKHVASLIRSAALSPTGVRAAPPSTARRSNRSGCRCRAPRHRVRAIVRRSASR